MSSAVTRRARCSPRSVAAALAVSIASIDAGRADVAFERAGRIDMERLAQAHALGQGAEHAFRSGRPADIAGADEQDADGHGGHPSTALQCPGIRITHQDSWEGTLPDMTLKAHGAHYIAPDIHGRISTRSTGNSRPALALSRARAAGGDDPAFRAVGARLRATGSTSWRRPPTSHPPVLQPRDRFGRDEDWIDYHPSYREMEKDRVRGLSACTP